MMTLLEVEVVMRVYRDLLKGFEERQRRGEFRLDEQVARSLKKARCESPGLRGRVFTRIGDFLISFGVWLRGRGRSDSSEAILQVR